MLFLLQITIVVSEGGMVKAGDFNFEAEFQCIGSPPREASKTTSPCNFVGLDMRCV